MRTDDRRAILHESPALLAETFDALDTHDPGLGCVMAITALTGIRAYELEQLSVEAIDLEARIVEPIWWSASLKASHRLDRPVLPIPDAVAPLFARLIDGAAAKRRPTLVGAATILPRWHHVRLVGKLGDMPRHAFRMLFAATLREVTRDDALIARSLGSGTTGSMRSPDDITAAGAEELRPLFVAVADRLAPLVLRPGFTKAPG